MKNCINKSSNYFRINHVTIYECCLCVLINSCKFCLQHFCNERKNVIIVHSGTVQLFTFVFVLQ